MPLNNDAALERALHFSASPAPMRAIRRRAGMHALRTSLHRALLCAAAVAAFGAATHSGAVPYSTQTPMPLPAPAPLSHADV